MKKAFTILASLGLASAASAQVAALSEGDSVLIGGVSFEQLIFEGFTYNNAFDLQGSAIGLYSDLTQAGDFSKGNATFPFESRVSAYWDGSNFSTVWDGESGVGNAPSTIGGNPLNTVVGETLNTVRRTTLGDILNLKDLDSEAPVLSNPDFTSNALWANYQNGDRISFVLDTTPFQVGTNPEFGVDFNLLSFAAQGLGTTINWLYAVDGGPLLSSGLSTVLTGAFLDYPVDFGTLFDGTESSITIVADLQGAPGSSIFLDSFAFGGSAVAALAVIPEPSAFAALGLAALGFVAVRRRRKVA